MSAFFRVEVSSTLIVPVPNSAVTLKVRTASGSSPVMAPSTPVSYTHLRAHETVLDLVCRLLLEKKKKKTNK